jgi:hypothetical protein
MGISGGEVVVRVGDGRVADGAATGGTRVPAATVMVADADADGDAADRAAVEPQAARSRPHDNTTSDDVYRMVRVT